MGAASPGSRGLWSRLLCGAMVAASAVILLLLPFAFPLPAPSLSPPLEIHNCHATCSPLLVGPKRKAPNPLTASQPVGPASLIRGPMWVWMPVKAARDPVPPAEPTYEGINQLAKPPPRRSRVARISEGP